MTSLLPLPFIFICLFISNLSADTRSDSIDILSYDISLSVRNLSSKTISGIVELKCISKKNGITKVNLDLLKLTIASVTLNNINQTWSGNDSMVFISLSQTQNTGDTFTLKISYSGQPKIDSKWGGFYFVSDYAFNLGVGFASDPHNFGRAWFPCFDNFTERSTYDLHVTTDSGYKAVCGGILKSSITNPDKSVTWNWSLGSPVPTYLVSVSVSKYEFVNSSYSGMKGNIPIMLAARAVDTLNMKSSFIHLPDAIKAFEKCFGPYEFERIGYNIIPFNGGAMEHACNISYPLFAVQGSTYYETLFAHELSHHWWGNLATCRTEADMWLNEGWASYSESIFLENLYGRESYLNDITGNHNNVLRFAQYKDGDFRPVYGIPHQYTYGEHVYHKGKDIIHTLRSYMGDSAFFNACKSYLNQYKFKDASTADLIAVFKNFAGGADLTSFFDDWVYNKGFCDFRILNFSADKNNQATVRIIQELRSAPHYYTNVPLTLTFFDSLWNKQTKNFVLSGADSALIFNLPFHPVLAIIDIEGNISYARTKNTVTVKNTGPVSLPEAMMDVNVSAITDSALLHIEHHWTMPDRAMCKIPGVTLSNYRYWKVDGIFPDNFKAAATVNYDGTKPIDYSSGYLDHTLILQREDSLRLVYRVDGNAFWQILPDSEITRQSGNLYDKKGSFTVKQLKKGEYALAMYDYTLTSIDNKINTVDQILIYPNPARDILKIRSALIANHANINIYDTFGKLMISKTIETDIEETDLDLSELQSGIYFISIQNGNKYCSKRIQTQ